MKNCPNCQKTPMPLLEWGVQLNPFRIKCKHCAERLSAEPSIYIGLVVLILLMPLSVFIGMSVFDIDFIEDRHWVIALLVAPAVIGGPVVYWLGGYKMGTKGE